MKRFAGIKAYVPVKDRVDVIRRLVADLEAAQARIKALEEGQKTP